MRGAAIRHAAEVGLCDSRMDARASGEEQLLEGARRANPEELTSDALGGLG